MTIVIVGASVAGVRTAQALRLRGHTGPISLLGEEPHAPYDKPPLSKDMLLPDRSNSAVPLLTAEELEALDIELRLGTRVVELDTKGRLVRTENDELVGFDELVIATGVTPRTVPGADTLAGVHTLRNLEDAVALRRELPRASRVVVIGAGFIGAEFSSAARVHGADVTIIEAQETPLAHILGEPMGCALAQLHKLNGVDVQTGVRFSHFEGDDKVSGVALADGRVLPADLVVVGIGASPATGWLRSSGLPIADGVECDESLRVLGETGIYAAGDVARWRHGIYDADLRIEHWTNANEHADIIAATITGGSRPAPAVPYVWSDQYGRRIQIAGRPAAGELQLVRGDIALGPLAGVYADAAGTVVGSLVVDEPRVFMKCRKAVARRSHIDDLDLGLAVG